jgi:mutator protein MutT
VGAVLKRRRGGAQYIPRPAKWALGDMAAPATHPLTLSVADIATALSDSPPGRPLAPAFVGSRLSAVLVAVADGDQGAEVLLTRRSMDLRHHRGEISFPGGRVDPGETPLQAALREAHEEVGLEPAAVEVFGELAHLNTVVSLSYIVPVVGLVAEPVMLQPTSPEVERVFWLPLAELVRPDTYRSERWGHAPTERLLHFFELDDETIWGATAMMLVDLLRRL